jgi:hypothetical protein
VTTGGVDSSGVGLRPIKLLQLHGLIEFSAPGGAHF